MSVQKSPKADLHRRYPLYAEVGLALALCATILAFTVPVRPSPPPVVEPPPAERITLEVPPTVEQPPPPPPPPAAPPPVEVVDDVEVEDILPDIEINLDEAVPAPSGPPAPPVTHVVPDVEPPPPPRAAIEDQDEGIRDFAQIQPTLIGGIEGLQSRVEYPEFARQVGIEGRVIVQFVVDEHGGVVDPTATVCPHDLLCEAAIKAVRESRFTPGQQQGRLVKVRFAVPVTFRLR